LKTVFNRSKMTLNCFKTHFKGKITYFYLELKEFDRISVFPHFKALNEIINPPMRVNCYDDTKRVFWTWHVYFNDLVLLRALTYLLKESAKIWFWICANSEYKTDFKWNLLKRYILWRSYTKAFFTWTRIILTEFMFFSHVLHKTTNESHL